MHGLKNWTSHKAIDKIIKLKDVKPGKIYRMIKTYKESNLARIILSWI